MASTPTTPTRVPAYQWMLAWLLLIALLAFASTTEIGHTAIYYLLVLFLLFLLVTQYQFVAQSLAPVGQPVSATS